MADRPARPGAILRLPDAGPNGNPAGFDDTRMCYWKDSGVWWFYAPGYGAGACPNHRPVEHEDGSATFVGSVLMKRAGRPDLHGYIERGTWRNC